MSGRKNEENYIPEDDLICLRLSEEVFKNIEIDVNEDANKNINNAGFIFLKIEMILQIIITNKVDYIYLI